MSGAALVSGYAADLALGDPLRFHPVAGFGQVAEAAERAAYAPTRARGALYAGGLVTAAALAAELCARAAGRTRGGRGAFLATITWAALGGRSLVSEARGLAARLDARDLDGARAALPSLCGRDPAGLDAAGLSRATVESVAENTSDAVVGVLVWAVIAGPGGVAAYRATNTLDAMVGHHSERYESFGWAAARLDDALNWPAARAAAALTALCSPLVGGSPRGTWRAVRTYGSAHPSPNAGWMEAAFAGALGVRLGGPLAYDGRSEIRPALGDGRTPAPEDVRRAARLSLAVGMAAVALAGLTRGRRR